VPNKPNVLDLALSAESLLVPTDGWTPVEGDPHAWFNAVGDSLVRNYFDVPPDLPPWSGSLDGIRATYREALGNHGGLVEVERVTIGGHQAVRALLKVKQPTHGMAYMLVLTFPFRHCSFIVTVQCGEHGMTGMRDTAVAARLRVAPVGSDWRCADGQPWFSDPYDASHLGGMRRNRADDEEYDASFPDHPLSRVRAHLEQLRGITLPAETRTLAPFG